MVRPSRGAGNISSAAAEVRGGRGRGPAYETMKVRELKNGAVLALLPLLGEVGGVQDGCRTGVCLRTAEVHVVHITRMHRMHALMCPDLTHTLIL